MPWLSPLLTPEPLLALANPDAMVVKIGVVLVLLSLVHTGIAIDRSEINGVRTVVIPVRTATFLITGIGLIAFGLTLK